jgi:hypothetical protein
VNVTVPTLPSRWMNRIVRSPRCPDPMVAPALQQTRNHLMGPFFWQGTALTFSDQSLLNR